MKGGRRWRKARRGLKRTSTMAVPLTSRGPWPRASSEWLANVDHGPASPRTGPAVPVLVGAKGRVALLMIKVLARRSGTQSRTSVRALPATASPMCEVRDRRRGGGRREQEAAPRELHSELRDEHLLGHPPAPGSGLRDRREYPMSPHASLVQKQIAVSGLSQGIRLDDAGPSLVVQVDAEAVRSGKPNGLQRNRHSPFPDRGRWSPLVVLLRCKPHRRKLGHFMGARSQPNRSPSSDQNCSKGGRAGSWCPSMLSHSDSSSSI